jgi:hypothetical protein
MKESIYYQLTNYMEQGFAWKAISRSDGQEIPILLWDANAHYRVHKRSPLDPILSQMNPVYALIAGYFKSHFHILASTLR